MYCKAPARGNMVKKFCHSPQGRDPLNGYCRFTVYSTKMHPGNRAQAVNLLSLLHFLGGVEEDGYFLHQTC